MWEEIFNLILGTVNTGRGTAVASYSPPVTHIVNKTSLKDMLAKEAYFTPSHQSRCVKFIDMIEGGLTLPHVIYRRMWQYQQSQLTKATQRKLGSMQLHMNSERCEEPKIGKLKGGYTLSAGLVFQSWLKDIHFHVRDRRLMQREAIQLVKDFTAKHAQDELEFYMGMVLEEDQSFKGLIDHLHGAFQSGKMLSVLISDSYGQSQKAWETKDTFADNLQVLAQNIIAHKPSFHLEADNQLKAQSMHKLWDPYYVAMDCYALQSSLEEETFTRFWGCLVTMFGGHARWSKSSVTSKGIDTEVNQISDLESKLSKNSRQHQNKSNRQEAQINSMQNQNPILENPSLPSWHQGLMDPWIYTWSFGTLRILATWKRIA